MKKLFFVTLLSTILLATKVTAQSASIEKVISFDFKNLKPIQEKGVIKGYYFFYTIDKTNKEENLYGLSIYDNNLKQTHYKEVVKSNKIKLLGAQFNGDHFCFHFFDETQNNYEFIIYSDELIEKGKFFVSLPQEYIAMMKMTQSMGGGAFTQFAQTHTLVSLPETGFGVYGYGFDTHKFTFKGYNNSGNELWNVGTGNTEKQMYEYGAPISVTEEFITFNFGFFLNPRKPNEGEKFLISIDTKTGKTLSKVNITKLANPVAFYDLYTTPKGYIMCGEYFDKDLKQQLGIVIADVSDGVMGKETYISLKEDISKVVKDEKQLKLLENKFVLIHKITQTADNKLFIIGELYDKKYIYDMVIYEFQNNILSNVYFMPKQKNDISSLMSTFRNSASVGQMLKLGLFNGSDYCYTSLNSDKSSFTTVYCSYEKESKSNDYVVESATYTKESKIINDQVKLTSKPTSFTVLPAKPGYVAVFEYFKNEKKINIKFEKLNL